MKKISNPLTIIGIFAGIAEVAGTAVLPLMSESLQKIFIWYVMGFPILLVLLFFILLIFPYLVVFLLEIKQKIYFLLNILNRILLLKNRIIFPQK